MKEYCNDLTPFSTDDGGSLFSIKVACIQPPPIAPRGPINIKSMSTMQRTIIPRCQSLTVWS